MQTPMATVSKMLIVLVTPFSSTTQLTDRRPPRRPKRSAQCRAAVRCSHERGGRLSLDLLKKCKPLFQILISVILSGVTTAGILLFQLMQPSDLLNLKLAVR